MMIIGNDELGPALEDTIKCPKCGQEHPIEYGEETLRDGTRRPSKLLAFYRCDGNLYLAGINGRALK